MPLTLKGGLGVGGGDPAEAQQDRRAENRETDETAHAPTLARIVDFRPIQIEIDRALCIGSGDCVETAPDVFELDSEDKARVIDPDGAPLDQVIEAGGNCPVTAIFVRDESGDLYP